MKKKVAIVDFGLGNLLSIQRALKFLDFDNEIVQDGSSIDFDNPIILPGVGAFPVAMENIGKNRLKDVLIQAATNDVPIIGICLGMQILFEDSEEHKKTTGLGLLQGSVVKLKDVSCTIEDSRLPVIGWRNVVTKECLDSGKNSLKLKVNNKSFYFVHSYHAIVRNQEMIIASYSRNGENIVALVNKGNIWGIQFHPEKSGNCGLELLNYILSR